MIITMPEALSAAAKQNKAVAAFNVFGYEDAKASIDAAEAMGEPVILMANKPAVEHMPLKIFADMIRYLGERAGVGVCIHLDHSTSYDLIVQAIEAGFTSVMFDGSQLPYEENVAITRDVVRAAHACGVSVEAEIGAVGYADGTVFNAAYTDPDQAASFERDAGPDAIAISVGTVHRMNTQAAKLDFALMDRIVSRLHTPVVIHGSTGVSDADLSRLVRHGARKINIGTALRMRFGQSLREQLEADPKAYDRVVLYQKCMADVQAVAAQKIALLSGRG